MYWLKMISKKINPSYLCIKVVHLCPNFFVVIIFSLVGFLSKVKANGDLLPLDNENKVVRTKPIVKKEKTFGGGLKKSWDINKILVSEALSRVDATDNSLSQDNTGDINEES